MEKLQNYVAGALIAPRAERYFDNVEPATGLVYSQVPQSTGSDLAAAVAAAKQAFPAWAKVSQEERAAVLMRIADTIDKYADRLAEAEARDNGKPKGLAKAVDMNRAAANFRFFAHAATQFASESHIMPGLAVNYTRRDPLGIVGCISPWNLPLYLLTWKIAPALAAGNCVIAKPSEVTPMTAYIFSQVCMKI